MIALLFYGFLVVAVSLVLYARLASGLFKLETFFLFLGMSCYYVLGSFLVAGIKRFADKSDLRVRFLKIVVALASLSWPIMFTLQIYQFGLMEILLFVAGALLLLDWNDVLGRFIVYAHERYRIIGDNASITLPPETSRDVVNLAVFMIFLYALSLI